MRCGVYQIINKVTGQFYVGSSVDMDARFRKHLYDLRHNFHQKHLQNAWNQYGKDAFVFKHICYLEPEELKKAEQEILDALYSTGILYNVSPNAQGGVPYHTEESRQKISKRMLGKKNAKGPQKRVTCPLCVKEGGKGNMKRWHFDKCKHKGKSE
jgi:group I intron endonuclease